MTDSILVTTDRPQQLVDITEQVGEAAARTGVDEGAVLLYCPHTTCGLAVNEAELDHVGQQLRVPLQHGGDALGQRALQSAQRLSSGPLGVVSGRRSHRRRP